ncbi:MAG: hypothetical protein GVY17_09955 [Cyanobacteria bacterium]|jgi:hypothetical protein|nr:hypothetical protein [Cyanobacteria bacterium GSL.Bin21]
MDFNRKKIEVKLSVKSGLSSLLKLINNFLKLGIEILFRITQKINFFRVIYLDYVPRKNDIFIVTYPRSGTTLLQMILYQIMTDGNMDIPHISHFCPWFERFTKDSLEALPSPRVFKSHLSYKWIPKGPSKYIYVARNGKDVMVSFFHLATTHMNSRETFSEFFNRFMRNQLWHGSWFEHVAEWWTNRQGIEILFLKYEDLTDDLENCIQKIIEFCGFEVDPNKIPQILERCSFTFMKKHEDKFDHITEKMFERGFKMNSFIRQGKVGNWTEYLSHQQEALFEKEFEKRLGKFGIDFRVPLSKK